MWRILTATRIAPDHVTGPEVSAHDPLDPVCGSYMAYGVLSLCSQPSQPQSCGTALAWLTMQNSSL